jgi:hypothetical protein
MHFYMALQIISTRERGGTGSAAKGTIGAMDTLMRTEAEKSRKKFPARWAWIDSSTNITYLHRRWRGLWDLTSIRR